ncbi:hypothetical protein PHMEG_00012437 [Phytophthora megakarya]|uniref:Integrase catalytic domain-containing protein n=1 Tax=Phytophthora megakarya TaxID=4795 RepID=A0A225W8R8_9STRA|nr:hypothetical protein PHMEG_00012437 [Phytophthora megakarya]
MDSGPTVPQPIFEVVRPPKLVSWDHASLVSWYREWNHYVTKIRHRCTVIGESFERVVATVKGAIQPEVLDIISTYILQRPLEVITDNEVLQLIHTRSQTLVNEFVPDVTSLVRQSLHMNLQTDDCDARIFRYFQDFTNIVEENGLQGLIGKTDPSLHGYRDRMKARCRLLIDNLQPLVLKEQIQRLVELERRDCKTDDVALFNLILEHAKAQQRFHRMSKETGAARGSQRQSSSGQKQSTLVAKNVKGGGQPDGKSGGDRNKATPKPTKSSQPPSDGCLVCHGSHWMRECPTATAEQREQALARYRAAKYVTCVVMTSDEEELQLGKDTLGDLGINVDDMLAQLAHGADFVDDSDDFEVGDNSQELPAPEDVQVNLDRLTSESSHSAYNYKTEPFPKDASSGTRWASPVVPVRKPGSKSEFRLTIDYRAVNRATVLLAGTMPNPAAVMDKVNGAVALAKFDMKNGFWQLPLAEESQEVLSFMTDEGQMQRVLDDLTPDNAQVWIDDVLLYAKTMDTFVDVLRRFFLLLHRHNLKLNAKKSSLFQRQVVWYGRVISAELQYFIYKLDVEKKKVGRRNRNALNVEISWMEDISLVEDELCVFCDASLSGYSIVVTMVHTWDVTRPVEDQDHSQVICKGLNWPIIEKEAFPIIKACTELEYLLLRHKGFRLYCDHANLIHLSSPSMDVKQHVHDRLQRWSLRLLGLHYTIEHLSGEKNLWADMVSRWQPQSILHDEFVFPTLSDIVDSQMVSRGAPTSLPVLEEDGVLVVDHKPWIPTGAKDLLARIMVVAHCGSQGHRGEAAMENLLGDRFFVVQLHKKVSQFMKRPYGPTFTATTRNEALHWDFIYLGDSMGEMQYVLVLKDSLTHYCELFPCSTPTANVAAEGLIDWYKRYGCPFRLFSDQGVHFRNHTVDYLCARLKIERTFSPVYTPWLNDTVERFNRDLLQVLRALLIDYGLDFHEWPYLLPVVQANINHTNMRSLAGHSPAELFTGLESPSPLDMIEVVDIKEKKRLADMQRNTGSVCNFDVGDYVLWSRIDERLPNNKLLEQWLGPFRIIEAQPHAFNIQHLVTNKVYEVHGTRLKYYADADLNMDAEMRELVTSQGIVLDVAAIVDHRYNEDLHRWELRVQWVGLQPIQLGRAHHGAQGCSPTRGLIHRVNQR